MDTFTLDIGEKYTRMADLNIDKNGIELLSLGYEETIPFLYSADNQKALEQQAEIITKLYSNLKIKKKSANVIMPDSFTYSQIIEMPKLKEKELLAAIRYQADEFIPMAIESTTIDLEILKENTANNKLLILIIASPKQLVANLEKIVEMAHLIPETLENELSTAGKLLSEIWRPEKSLLLINIGYSTSSLYLVESKTGLIIAARTFKVGLDIFIKDIKVNTNWEDKKIAEVLQNPDVLKNPQYGIEPIVNPLIKEFLSEVEKFIILSRDRYNVKVEEIYTYNYDMFLSGIQEKIVSTFSIPTRSLLLQDKIKPNPIAQSFSRQMSSFISVIAGSIQ